MTLKDALNFFNLSYPYSLATLKEKYKKLIKKYHPDVNPDGNNSELSKNINEAYDICKSELKKRTNLDINIEDLKNEFFLIGISMMITLMK